MSDDQNKVSAAKAAETTPVVDTSIKAVEGPIHANASASTGKSEASASSTTNVFVVEKDRLVQPAQSATTVIQQRPSNAGTILAAVLLSVVVVGTLLGVTYYAYLLGQANPVVRPTLAQTRSVPALPPSTTPPALTTPAPAPAPSSIPTPGATNIAPAQSDGPKSCVSVNSNVQAPLAFIKGKGGGNGEVIGRRITLGELNWVQTDSGYSTSVCLAQADIDAHGSQGFSLCTQNSGAARCWVIRPIDMAALKAGTHQPINLFVKLAAR